LNPTNLADEIRELSTLYRAAPISGRSLSPQLGVRKHRTLWEFYVGHLADGLWLCRLSPASASGEGLLFFCVLGVTAAALVFASSRGVVMGGGGAALVAAVAFVWGAPWRKG